MIPLRPAQTLREAYAVLDPNRSLDGEWFEAFYVERPGDSGIQPLVDELQLDLSEDDKTLLYGHRGSGKSTELARLEQALRKDHLCVRLNVEERLNLGDIDYADLLVSIGLAVFQSVRQSGIRVDPRHMEDLLFWYRTRILEEDETRVLQSEVGGEIDALIARFHMRLATEAPRRERVRAEAQAHLSDLLDRLNRLLQDVKRQTGRRVLVIVDDLDKLYDLDQVVRLFVRGANALLEPQCRILFTIPLAIAYTDDFHQARLAFHRVFSFPNLKVWERDGSPSDERETLRRILKRRMADHLLELEAAEQLIEASGGLLKELIGLARQATLRALRERGEQGPIGSKHVEYAIRQVRNAYRAALTEEQLAELSRLRKGGAFVHTPVARSLLHNLSLLQYDGEGIWWALHPIVRPVVEEWEVRHGRT